MPKSNKIVKHDNNIYAFQCHLEITLDRIKTMIETVPEDLKPSKYTQTEKELLQEDYSSINHMMINTLDRLVK